MALDFNTFSDTCLRELIRTEMEPNALPEKHREMITERWNAVRWIRKIRVSVGHP